MDFQTLLYPPRFCRKRQIFDLSKFFRERVHRFPGFIAGFQDAAG
jgi:hypothetical protein